MNRLSVFLLLITVTLGATLVVKHGFAACCGSDQREPSVCPNISCEWERSDGRCNDSEECCPGKECDVFGFCQRCSNC